MKITSLVLADYAYQARGGKPVVAGVFRVIFAPFVPVVHRRFCLFHEIEVDLARGEGLPEISLVCNGPDKQEVFSAQGVPAKELSESERSEPIHVLSTSLTIDDVLLPEYGLYEIVASARYKRKRARHRIRFRVVRAPEESSPRALIASQAT